MYQRIKHACRVVVWRKQIFLSIFVVDNTMKTYRIASVRRCREDGRENVLLADLLNDEGVTVITGPLAQVLRVCEERSYSVSNIEQAKIALSRQ